MKDAASASESLIHRLESILVPLPVANLFPRAQPLEVELGAGDGSFLVAWAQAHPECNFLGVERLLGRLRKIDRKGRRLGLENLRLVRIEADYLSRYLLPARGVRALHIYFPDPWPKRRHWKNRLITEAFATMLPTVLEPGGRVFLRTDHPEYFQQMLASFTGHKSYRPVETPAELLAFKTDFERGFQARGVPTLEASFQCVH